MKAINPLLQKILALFDKSDEYYKSKNFVAAERSLQSLINQTLSLHLACLGLCYLHKAAKTKMKVLHIRRSVVFEPESAINWTALGMVL